MRDQYMRCGEGFMICYSVTDRHSFQEAVEYRKLINRVRATEDIPLVLVGNKFDLQQVRKVYQKFNSHFQCELGIYFDHYSRTSGINTVNSRLSAELGGAVTADKTIPRISRKIVKKRTPINTRMLLKNVYSQ